MPGTVLGARGTAVNQTDTNVCAHEAHILLRGASIRQSFWPLRLVPEGALGLELDMAGVGGMGKGQNQV